MGFNALLCYFILSSSDWGVCVCVCVCVCVSFSFYFKKSIVIQSSTEIFGELLWVISIRTKTSQMSLFFPLQPMYVLLFITKLPFLFIASFLPTTYSCCLGKASSDRGVAKLTGQFSIL
jgi:hypothetical protein